MIQWVPWTDGESYAAYLKRAQSSSSLGVVLGRGLGRRMKAADPEFVPAPVLWRAKAVPSHYGYADVACLFSDLDFDSVTIHGRHRGRKTCDWTFKATRPDRAPMLQQHIDWGNDLESELVIVKESARMGNPANSAPFQSIASGRTVTFGEVAAVAPKRTQNGRRTRRGAPQESSDPSGEARGSKRAVPGEDAGSTMTVDEEGATAARPDWTPLASVMSNPGEGNCLFHALSQLDLGGRRAHTASSGAMPTSASRIMLMRSNRCGPPRGRTTLLVDLLERLRGGGRLQCWLGRQP